MQVISLSERLEEAEGGAENQVRGSSNARLSKHLTFPTLFSFSLKSTASVMLSWAKCASFLKMFIWNLKKRLICWRRSIKKLLLISMNKLKLSQSLKIGKYLSDGEYLDKCFFLEWWKQLRKDGNEKKMRQNVQRLRNCWGFFFLITNHIFRLCFQSNNSVNDAKIIFLNEKNNFLNNLNIFEPRERKKKLHMYKVWSFIFRILFLLFSSLLRAKYEQRMKVFFHLT